MEKDLINFKDIQKKRDSHNLVPADINLAQVFNAKGASYLNEFNLFVAFYNTIPSCIGEEAINCPLACKRFAEVYKSEVKDYYFERRCGKGRQTVYENVLFVLYEDLVVCFDHVYSRVHILFNTTSWEKVEKIVSWVRKYREKVPKKRADIYVLVNSRFMGIDTELVKLRKQELNVKENYNDDFLEIHKIIFERLSKKNDKGLVLLHGAPGTGKSSYIRYLTCEIDKNFIFLPPTMAGSLTNPDLIKMLMGHRNSVLVIEDAENILIDRTGSGYSPVSALLNITDGLLSDCLNVQVICSFNTDLSKIDKALVRKGRLIAKYDFRKLGPAKANVLSEKLGIGRLFTVPVALTDVYNGGEKAFDQQSQVNTIGFKTVNVN